MLEILNSTFTEIENQSNSILVAGISDNCNKITIPMFEVCSQRGMLAVHCTAHTFNLALIDLWNNDKDMNKLNKKIAIIIRMIMNN